MLITVVQILIGLVFLSLSFFALTGVNYTTRKLAQLGLPKYFRYVTGSVQLVGGIMLLLGVLFHPTFSIIGGAWVAMIMVVGIFLRVRARDSFQSMLPAIIIGILALTVAISGGYIMKIGIIGASGKAGNAILQESLDHEHEVTAIVRDASKLSKKNLAVIEKTIFDLTSADVSEFDVVVNAFGAPLGEEQSHVDAGHALIEAVKGTDTRIMVVGGAGSLYVDENKTIQVVDTPEFPDLFVPTAKGQGRNLEELQATSNISWTFVSPSAVFDADGKRTGSYQTGKDHLLVNSKGESYVSYADYAIAIVDEIENTQHLNERFTVVGEAE